MRSFMTVRKRARLWMTAKEPFKGGMYMRFLRQALGAFVFALCAITLVSAQENAEIIGTVTDKTGAAVPNATVTLTHLATGSVRTSASNSSGLFDFPGLAVGNYDLKA